MKILVVMNAQEVRLGGGIIQVILNLKDEFKNYGDFKFDYAINSVTSSGIKEILENDTSKFYQLPNKSKRIGRYISHLVKICKKGGYDVIHIHGSSSTMIVELLCAWLAGIKKRIVHCHNSQCSHPLINSIAKPYMNKLMTVGLACSELAGNWVYGENNFTIIHNAFDSKDYIFNDDIRKEERRKLGIPEEVWVFGMVGNLNEQKNPFFSLEIFKQVCEKISSILVYIGDGPMRARLKNKVREYRLENKVIFLGICQDVSRKLQMIDFFLFPSLFEGLGNSLLEAQAAGCICVASDSVPEETKYSSKTRYFSLLDMDRWTEYIYFFVDDIEYNRMKESKTVVDKLSKTYDIKKEVIKLKMIYEI